MILHPLPHSTNHIPDPERFTYPFCYTPHALCLAASHELRTYLKKHDEWQDELSAGKMMGVLVVRHHGERGFLAAFSGTLGGQTVHEYFVPPVFDTMAPGCHFQQQQERISAMNIRLTALQRERSRLSRLMRMDELQKAKEQELQAIRERNRQARVQRQELRESLPPDELALREEVLRRESQFQKAELKRVSRRWDQAIQEAEAPLLRIMEQEKALATERKQNSEALQQWLFGQYRLLNAQGETRSVSQIFGTTLPPSGTGDCCGPKLLQAAYSQGMTPLCMGEFWVGRSPTDELRQDGQFYPACHSRCMPLLTHMIQGLSVESNPLDKSYQQIMERMSIEYADSSIVVVRKPEGMLSVPGNSLLPSVQDVLRQEFPTASGPLIVHRLDMDTSGLMVAALTPEAYHSLQQQFLRREVQKTYVALLEVPLPIGQEGKIALPLRPDLEDRPRQMVDLVHGKHALTHYQVTDICNHHARVLLRPFTGRTHQLRVHCAHPAGLGNAIVGDRLYGKVAQRLMLHAQQLSFTHPLTGQQMQFRWDYI
ncbi:MAG: pseudouridine synthase [Bacteroidaceae bacterium]